MPESLNVGARSRFVTATAWLFIVLALMAATAAVLHNASLASLLPGLRAQAGPGNGLSAWVLGYLPWVLGAGLLMAMATLAFSIGLLLRLEWARKGFIGVLGLAVAVNVVGLWVQQEVVAHVVSRTLKAAPLPAQVVDVFGSFVTATSVMGVVVSLLTCAFLGWTMHRLMTPDVRREFA